MLRLSTLGGQRLWVGVSSYCILYTPYTVHVVLVRCRIFRKKRGWLSRKIALLFFSRRLFDR